jgi:preprotein translocase subunit YajC
MGSFGFYLFYAVVLLAGFYLLVVRPQRKRNLAHQALVDSLAVGDDVVTVGGFIGRITGIDAQEHLLELELSPGTRVNVVREAIARKVLHQTDGDAESTS